MQFEYFTLPNDHSESISRLAAAAAYGNIEMVKSLFLQSRNSEDAIFEADTWPSSKNAFYYAVFFNRFEIVKFFLEKASQKNKIKLANLEYAYSGQVENVFDIACMNVVTATKEEDYKEAFKIVKILLQNGADPNKGLITAVESGSLKLVTLLLKNKADPLLIPNENDPKYTWGNLLYRVCRQNKSVTRHKIFQLLIKELTEKGANIQKMLEQKGRVYDNVLQIAASAGCPYIVKDVLVLMHKASGTIESYINMQESREGYSALMLASQGGTNFNQSNGKLKEYSQVVGLLLCAGANKDLVNKKGRTAFDIAVINYSNARIGYYDIFSDYRNGDRAFLATIPQEKRAEYVEQIKKLETKQFVQAMFADFDIISTDKALEKDLAKLDPEILLRTISMMIFEDEEYKEENSLEFEVFREGIAHIMESSNSKSGGKGTSGDRPVSTGVKKSFLIDGKTVTRMIHERPNARRTKVVLYDKVWHLLSSLKPAK